MSDKEAELARLNTKIAGLVDALAVADASDASASKDAAAAAETAVAVASAADTAAADAAAAAAATLEAVEGRAAEAADIAERALAEKEKETVRLTGRIRERAGERQVRSGAI